MVYNHEKYDYFDLKIAFEVVKNRKQSQYHRPFVQSEISASRAEANIPSVCTQLSYYLDIISLE